MPKHLVHCRVQLRLLEVSAAAAAEEDSLLLAQRRLVDLAVLDQVAAVQPARHPLVPSFLPGDR